MIELRWIIREESYEVGKLNDLPIKYFQDVKVLQYRQGSYPYQPPHEKEWSGTDWIDVPTVPDQP